MRYVTYWRRSRRNITCTICWCRVDKHAMIPHARLHHAAGESREESYGGRNFRDVIFSGDLVVLSDYWATDSLNEGPG